MAYEHGFEGAGSSAIAAVCNRATNRTLLPRHFALPQRPEVLPMSPE